MSLVDQNTELKEKFDSYQKKKDNFYLKLVKDMEVKHTEDLSKSIFKQSIQQQKRALQLHKRVRDADQQVENKTT